jgi:Immunoglobulin I-set domain
MKRFVFCLVLFATTRCFAQTPPNDEFTNRTVISGSPFDFTAATATATRDELNEPGYADVCCGLSLWWSWTPTQNTQAIIERTDEFSSVWAYLVVYTTTNLSLDSRSDQVAGIHLAYRGQYTAFEAHAGTEYQISVAAWDPTPLHFRFTATNSPVFRLHPRPQTVSAGQSVLFTGSAIATTPIQYQWQWNGVDLPGATNHCLAIYNADGTNAGDYVLVATSTTGVSTSRLAHLWIRTTDVRPILIAGRTPDPTTFQFTVKGEEGCVYRREESMDLLNWAGPVIFNTNATTTFQIPKDSPVKWMRLSLYHPANEICNCNLKQIWYALWQCSEDRHKSPEAPFTRYDLAPYCMNGQWPQCPLLAIDSYGSYVVSDAQSSPSCLWGAPHFFEER